MKKKYPHLTVHYSLHLIVLFSSTFNLLLAGTETYITHKVEQLQPGRKGFAPSSSLMTHTQKKHITGRKFVSNIHTRPRKDMARSCLPLTMAK